MPTNRPQQTSTLDRPRARASLATALRIARSVTVTSGGPALLALASAADWRCTSAARASRAAGSRPLACSAA